MNSHEVFIHIHQGWFAGTGAIVRLPQCQWSKPDGYGKINQCITTKKHSRAKTVCIFLGIYCRVFPPLNVIITTRRRGMLATWRCRHYTGISAYLSSRAWQSSPIFGAGCPYWWLHGPIYLKHVLWGHSLAILQAAPSWWYCLAEGNQGLPEHGDVWRYHLGNGNYLWNGAWQVALV